MTTDPEQQRRECRDSALEFLLFTVIHAITPVLALYRSAPYSVSPMSSGPDYLPAKPRSTEHLPGSLVGRATAGVKFLANSGLVSCIGMARRQACSGDGYQPRRDTKNAHDSTFLGSQSTLPVCQLAGFLHFPWHDLVTLGRRQLIVRGHPRLYHSNFEGLLGINLRKISSCRT